MAEPVTRVEGVLGPDRGERPVDPDLLVPDPLVPDLVVRCADRPDERLQRIHLQHGRALAYHRRRQERGRVEHRADRGTVAGPHGVEETVHGGQDRGPVGAGHQSDQRGR